MAKEKFGKNFKKYLRMGITAAWLLK